MSQELLVYLIGLLIVVLAVVLLKSRGPVGQAGQKGLIGVYGPQGNVGALVLATGPQGLKGPTGPVGARGPTGQTGPSGPGTTWSSFTVTATGPGDAPSATVTNLGLGAATLALAVPDTWPFLLGTVTTTFGGPQPSVAITVEPSAPYAVDFDFTIVAGPSGPQGPQGVPSDGLSASGPQGPQGTLQPGPQGLRGFQGPTGPSSVFGYVQPWTFCAGSPVGPKTTQTLTTVVGLPIGAPIATSFVSWWPVTVPVGAPAILNVASGQDYGLSFTAPFNGHYRIDLMAEVTPTSASGPISSDTTVYGYVQAVIYNGPAFSQVLGPPGGLYNWRNAADVNFLWSSSATSFTLYLDANNQIAFPLLASPENPNVSTTAYVYPESRVAITYVSDV